MNGETTTRRRHATPRPALTPREIRFCKRLFLGDTRVAAYHAAGFPPRPPDRAARAAGNLYRKREVRLYLRRLQYSAAAEAKITVERLAELLLNIATADFRKLVDDRGAFLPVAEWPDDLALAIEVLETEERFAKPAGKSGEKELVGYVRKVRLGPVKLAALRLLMEWRRMVGKNAAPAAAEHRPLVIGGQADPGKL